MQERIPPITANINQACYKCFKEETDDVSLLKCSRCRRVSYCNAGCQKADWNQHKVFCKASYDLENGEAQRAASVFSLADAPNTDTDFLNHLAERQGTNKLQFCQFGTRRQLNVLERNLIGWEPRCMACVRTDQDIRMMSSPGAKVPTLKPCLKCKTTFYCSEVHWDAVKHIHEEPCQDGHDGLSQCEVNQEIRADVRFAEIMAGADAGSFQWAPSRTKSIYTSLEESNWAGEYGKLIAEDFRLPTPEAVGPFMRAASDSLSMPVTILWALERLNEDDAWTKKKTLNIHILGAYDLELMKAMIFEEILHQLPDVTTLKLVMCGPQLIDLIPPRQHDTAVEMDTCQDCHNRGRKRIHYHYALPYHDLVKKLGDGFVVPDLAIAFNSGSSQEAVASWQTTMDLLVKRKIPSVFTAYNREEAENEAKILKTVGAKLVASLGPKKNPWGSILARKEPNKVTGFYAVNGWLAGGFR